MPFPGLPKKATYEVAVITECGRHHLRWSSVPAEKVVACIANCINFVGWRGHRILVDDQDVTAAARATREIILGGADNRIYGRAPEPSTARADTGVAPACDVTHAWRFLLTNDDVLHRLPLASDSGRDPALQGGSGLGGLRWEPITDHGMQGLGAAARIGVYKILRVGRHHYALFHERKLQDWDAIAAGEPETLKQLAGRREAARYRLPRAERRLIPPPLPSDSMMTFAGCLHKPRRNR